MYINHKYNYKNFFSDKRGFTLLEVIIAMLIISLLLSTAWPSFSRTMERFKLINDAQNLAGEMKNARQYAITTFNAQTFYFYVDSNKYMWEGRNIYLSRGNRFVGKTTFTKKNKATPICVFLPSGAPNQAGAVTLTNVWGDKRYVIVNLASGRIRVSSTPPDSWE